MSLRDWPALFGVFGRIGLLSFGGPAAQISLMHNELVTRHRWLSEAEFLRALSLCMLLPGPEAMQLATYSGWKLRGVPGGLLAGGLFVLPGAAVMLALAAAYVAFGSLPGAAAIFLGVKASVVVIVIEALLRVSRKALKSRFHLYVALAAFLAIFVAGVGFPVIMLAAAALGAVFATQPLVAGAAPPQPVSGRHLMPTFAIGLGLWAAPLVAVWVAGQELALAVGLFFSKLALVTFGGAYAVLAYMTQEMVQGRGWLTTAQMMDALGLAETTPGPLILVTEFTAYLTGFAAGGTWLAVMLAALTLWVTFVPCFLWIFAFAPYVEAIAARPRLGAALSGITAAVVGVIANLAIWFALHVFFSRVRPAGDGLFAPPLPDLTSFQPTAFVIAAVAAYLLLGRHWNLVTVIGLAAFGGWLLG